MTLPDEQHASAHAGVADGDNVWSVRPEHCSHTDTKADVLKVRQVVIQPTGSRSYGIFYLAETHVIAELEAHAMQWSGKTVTLGVDIDSNILFDRQTGNRIP